jgi:hypothetical protein
MKRLLPISLILVSALCSAFADFEGTIEMKLTMAGEDGTVMGGGTMNLSVGKPGSRMEMNMQSPMPMKMTMITRADAPDKVYQVNDNSHTYSEMNVSKDTNAPTGTPDKDPWNVKKLGEEKVLGYKTQHVLATHGQEKWELWTSKELIDYATYRKLQSSRGRMGGDERMVKALKDADVDGMPMKAIVEQGGMKTTVEVVKADKKSLPGSTFAVPAGYTKTSGGFPGVAGSADPRVNDAMRRREEALKNLTPEQREMVEKMMKQRQQQGANPGQP